MDFAQTNDKPKVPKVSEPNEIDRAFSILRSSIMTENLTKKELKKAVKKFKKSIKKII